MSIVLDDLATTRNSVFDILLGVAIGDSVILWCCTDLNDVRGIVVDSTGTINSIVDADFTIVRYPLLSRNSVASGESLEVDGSRVVVANEGVAVV